MSPGQMLAAGFGLSWLALVLFAVICDLVRGVCWLVRAVPIWFCRTID
jgi:hypothetical protein